MKLVVGLGNPGKEYANTRHNAGFLAVEKLAEDLDARWILDAKHKAEVAKITIDGTQVLLVKPTTYMNLSGESVQPLASYYKIAPANILVVQDEMDHAPGLMTFKLGGGNAGHNGIASIAERLGTSDFARLRIGIGRPAPPMPKESWVLGKIELPTLTSIAQAPDAIKDWIAHGTEKAMNSWNQK